MTFPLIFFVIEIHDRLVVEETVCVDNTRNLVQGVRFRHDFGEERIYGQTMPCAFLVRHHRVRQRIRRLPATTEQS